MEVGDSRSRCADAARVYVAHGWPVLPGTTWTGSSGWVGVARQQRASGLRPSVPRTEASADPERVRAWWSVTGPVAPSVLLVTGAVFDVVAVPGRLGRQLLRLLVRWQQRGPVVFRPDTDTVYLLVQAPDPADMASVEARLAAVGADLLPRGSWLAAPPTVLPGGRVHWLITPQRAGWCPMRWSTAVDALSIAAAVTAPPRASLRAVSR